MHSVCLRYCLTGNNIKIKSIIALIEHVCVSVREHIAGATRAIFTTVVCMLPTAVARSSPKGKVQSEKGVTGVHSAGEVYTIALLTSN